MAAHLISSSFLVSSFFLLYSFPLHSVTACPPLPCGNLSRIDFPFFVFTDEPHPNWDLKCGFLPINCSEGVPKFLSEVQKKSYLIKNISYKEKTLLLQDRHLLYQLQQGICGFLDPFETPGYEFLRGPTLTLFRCNLYEYNPLDWPTKEYYSHTLCPGKDVLFFTEKEVSRPPLKGLKGCTPHQLPIQPSSSNSYRNDSLLSIVEAGFTISWEISPSCINDCLPNNRTCVLEDITTGNITCPAVPKKEGRKKTTSIVLIAIGVGVGTLFCIVVFASVSYLWYRRKRPTAAAPSRLLSRTISSYPSTKSEEGYYSTTFPTKIFSYKELQEATNNFDPSKELGNGGFGIVYHGKLRDGRCVAVKRLYKNHYKHIQQFMNEIEILSRLRHPNLVVLYGCTSHQSRELLLVYEFIPNGTLADHLHGNLAESGALTWLIRMSIAIETADALAHLHAVEIIHRDVKTNNILLDNYCHVKVADFGLSRLFPLDKTHVSTAPQGTIGYVDPDYHRCYQLNEKSDVYSFGVVLIELISSKPAVDLSRHRHEINLANLAINKICNQELPELIDPRLGFELDSSVGRMITMVAELALRCLHDEKDMRPSMQEVLEVLKGIQSEVCEVEKTEVGDLSIDEIANLKNIKPVSLDFLKNASTIKFNTPNATS